MIARLAAGLALAAACVVTESRAQQASPQNGPVASMQDAAMQDYALRLRDAEARLRAAHERLAAGSSPASRTPSDPPARQQLVDAARDAWTVVRSAPGDAPGRGGSPLPRRPWAPWAGRWRRRQRGRYRTRDASGPLSAPGSGGCTAGRACDGRDYPYRASRWRWRPKLRRRSRNDPRQKHSFR